MRLFSAPPLVATGLSGGGGGDPYWSDVELAYDFTTSSTANLGNAGSSYDLSLNGTVALTGGSPDELDFPGGASDYATTGSGNWSGITPSGSTFAFEVFDVSFDNLTAQNLFGTFVTTGNQRAFLCTLVGPSQVNFAVHQSGTNIPNVTLVTGGLSLSTGAKYYMGFFADGTNVYSYIGASGGSFGTRTAQAALTYTPFSTANPFQISGYDGTTGVETNSQWGGFRYTASNRGVTGGALTPDTLPLATS